jgi:hypothetical protein
MLLFTLQLVLKEFKNYQVLLTLLLLLKMLKIFLSKLFGEIKRELNFLG